MANAVLLNVFVQMITLFFMYLTSDNICKEVCLQQILVIRMDLENNESRTVLAAFLNPLMWISLVHQRNKHFKIPSILGYLILNIFFMSHVYLQSVIVMHQGPVPVFFFLFLYLGDQVFTYFYLLLQDYIYPVGVFGFCAAPKVTFTLGFYFYYDDQLDVIMLNSILTTIICVVQGLAMEELLRDCYDEKIDNFGVIDYYVLIYLDIKYILKKAYLNGIDHVLDFKDWIYSKKRVQKRLQGMSESDNKDKTD
ncbi:UNKNOWN [Stylonychia lemnae]|uniref:Uncharacterized protein n=1 Tax=Stylonychia lemnae TaxID=5949 RepID=A0A077ZSS7_STYLE|nr:UNKNOWN [Stylonychia lemnae]|eukprot:CDW72932.1 UNKNOWN [Stylonychia lemnae]